MSKGGINIRAKFDNKELKRGIEESKQAVKKLGSSVQSEGEVIAKAMKRVETAVKGAFTVAAAKQFLSQMTEIRGQFQQLEIAFSTILGSATQADALMQQLVTTAAKTPFDLTGIAESAKQLIAYGVSADKVNDTLLMLGDIASGLSLPLTDIAYLYGTTVVQGRMFTQDLRQFTGRGIPMIQQLAKQFGVAESAVGDLVSKGKVGLKEFQQAMEGIHADKFSGLMEKQSASLTGKLANLEDAVDIMMNKFGEASEGVIGGAIDLASELVENYEAVGRALMELAGAVGVYKASMFALMEVSKGYTLLQIAEIKWLTIKEALQKRLAMSNPYGALALGITVLVAGMYKLVTATTEAEKAQKALNESLNKGQGMIEAERLKVETLFATLRHAKKGTTEWNNARNAILKEYGKYLEGLSKEIQTLKDVEGAYNAVKKAAIESARARAMESATNEAQERYSEKMQEQMEEVNRIVDTTYKNTAKNADKRAKLKADLYAIMREEKTYNDLTEEQMKDLSKHSWSGGLFGQSLSNTSWVQNLQSQAKKAAQIYKESVDEIYSAFGGKVEAVSEPTVEDTTKSELTDEEKQEAEKRRKEQERRLQAIAEYEDKVKVAEAEAELEIRASKLSTREEGLDKELETAKLQYDREKHQMKLLATKWVEEYKEAHGVKSATVADLTKEQQDLLGQFNTNALERYADNESRIYGEVLKKYQGYTEKRAELERKYQKEREELKKAGASDESLAELDRSEQEALKAVDEQFASREGTFRAWMARMEKMTLVQLKKALEKAKKALDEAEKKGGVSPEDLAVARASVNALSDEIKEREEKTDSKSSAEKSAEDWQKLYETLVRVQGEFDKIADSVGGAVGETLSFASTCMTTTLTAINGITTLANWSTKATEMSAKGASKAMIAAEKASVILTIIGAVIKMAMMVKSVIDANDKVEQDALRFRGEVEGLNRSLEYTKLVAREAGKALQIFSGDGYNKAVSDIRISEEAHKRLMDVMQRGVDKYKKTQEELSEVPFFRHWYNENLDAIEELSQKYGAALGDMWIQTKETSKFLFIEWGGESKKLRDLVPELFNQDQSINMEALDKFIGSSTYEKLSDQAKQSLSELQKAHKDYEESLKGMRDYLKGVFGSLGEDIMGNIVEAFRKGEDATKSFAESVERTLEKMVQNMIFSSLFSDLFNKAEKDLSEMMKKGSSEEQYIDYFNRLMTQIEGRSELVEKRLKNAQEAGDKRGLNLFKDKDGEKERRTPQKRGIAQASQDSVDELNGRATAIQGHTYTISENSKLLVTNTNAILTHVAGIHRNTDELQRLRAIEGSIVRMDKSLVEVTTRGVKMK